MKVKGFARRRAVSSSIDLVVLTNLDHKDQLDFDFFDSQLDLLSLSSSDDKIDLIGMEINFPQDLIVVIAFSLKPNALRPITNAALKSFDLALCDVFKLSLFAYLNNQIIDV